MASENHIYKLSNAGGFKTLTRYPDMLAGNTVWNPWSPQGAYDALSVVTVPTGGVSTVTFAGIPQTYKHLQIRALIGNPSSVSMTINNGSFARRHYLYGAGSGSPVSGSDTSNDIMAGADNALIRAANIIDILDYTNTNKTKTYRILGGADFNGSGTIIMFSALDLSTFAINSITLTSNSGNFREFSQFALYGVK